MDYFIHYNMKIGGEDANSIKDAIKKGYAYLNKHPTSKSVLNIYKYPDGKFSQKNVGIMYWDNVNGKRRIVFDSSNAKSGYYNIAYADGKIGDKIYNRHKEWMLRK